MEKRKKRSNKLDRRSQTKRQNKPPRLTKDRGQEPVISDDNVNNQIEGRNPVKEAIRSGRTIEKILVSKGDLTGSIGEILRKTREAKIIIQEVDRKKLDEISVTGSHQGIIAHASAHSYVDLDDIVKISNEKGEDSFIIILDEVTDPYNLGSILRTADAAGAHGVIIPKRRSVGLTPLVAKSSAGAIEYTPVARVTNIVQTIEELKEKGFWIAGAEAGARDYYYQANLKGPIALVIGSEGKGIGRLIKEKCDFLLKIPMLGRVSSLNAAIAGAILMYEVRKQRREEK